MAFSVPGGQAARRLARACVAFGFGLALAAGAHAQHRVSQDTKFDAETLAIDEQRFLGTPLDADLALVDHRGRHFKLGELMGRPTLLVFSYYTCDGTCPVINRQLAEAIAGVKRFRAGTDFNVITVSFDKKDGVRDIEHFLKQIGVDDPDQKGWRIAVFSDGEDIKRIAEKVGYKWFWSLRDRVFVHPSVMMVLSPELRLVRYLPAYSIGPSDVELGLIESDWGKITGSAKLLDIARGVCFSYSYKDGRYVVNAPLFIAAGSVSIGALSIIAAFGVYRRKKRKEEEQHANVALARRA